MTPGAEYRMSPQGIRNQGSAAGARRLVRSIVVFLRLANPGCLTVFLDGGGGGTIFQGQAREVATANEACTCKHTPMT